MSAVSAKKKYFKSKTEVKLIDKNMFVLCVIIYGDKELGS